MKPNIVTLYIYTWSTKKIFQVSRSWIFCSIPLLKNWRVKWHLDDCKWSTTKFPIKKPFILEFHILIDEDLERCDCSTNETKDVYVDFRSLKIPRNPDSIIHMIFKTYESFVKYFAPAYLLIFAKFYLS